MNSIKDLPFNVKLLSADKKRLALIRPTTSTDIFNSASGGFNENGLYSTLTFGNINSIQRDTIFSYIDLNTTIIHPFIFREILKLNNSYKDIFTKKRTFIFDNQIKDFAPSVEEGASNGYGFFMQHYLDLELKPTGSDRRQLRIDLINKYRNESLIEIHLILPAGFRDYEVGEDGREIENELNPLYRTLIALSRSIDKDEFEKNNPIYDNSRWRMQEYAEQIFDVLYRMLTGKQGFIQKKFARRRVFDGTRNVISSMDTSAAIMNSPKQPKVVDTAFGLFQTLRGIMPLVVNLLRNDWLSRCFSEENEYANLIDPNSLTPTVVKLSLASYEKWTSSEGLEKIIMGFRYPSKRHTIVSIDGYYLALIYQDDKYFKLFDDIQSLPENLDKSKVRPITWGELFYHCLYEKLDDIYAIVTRYPVTGQGSTYPCRGFIQTTVNPLTLIELDDNWDSDSNSRVYYQWPNVLENSQWIDSMSPSGARLKLLGADFDGDTMSATFVYSQEAIEECRNLINSKKVLLDANNDFFAGIVTDLCEWTLLNLTS